MYLLRKIFNLPPRQTVPNLDYVSEQEARWLMKKYIRRRDLTAISTVAKKFPNTLKESLYEARDADVAAHLIDVLGVPFNPGEKLSRYTGLRASLGKHYAQINTDCPLAWHALWGNTRVVQTLIERGVSVAESSLCCFSEKVTAEELALRYGHKKTVDVIRNAANLRIHYLTQQAKTLAPPKETKLLPYNK